MSTSSSAPTPLPYPLAPTSIARNPSAIRSLQPFLNLPNMISLGGGAPNPATFPVASMALTMKDGTVLEIGEEETKVVMQYTSSTGLPGLSRHLDELCQRVHGTIEDHIVTNGSQDGLAKAFEMLLKPGEAMLVESPTYSGSLAWLEPMGVKLVGVGTDGDGVKSDDFERVLEGYEEGDEKKPRVFYTIPTGSNPSGGTATEERKRRVYDLCVKHDVIILEDDPYYYMNFDIIGQNRDVSYLKIDSEYCEKPGALQRVLRFDSFSKIIAAGIRVGWCTGPKPLIERLELHTQSTLLHPSGISQGVVKALFDEWGGAEGFLKHADEVCSFYKERRDFIVKCVEETGLAPLVEFEVPKAGMFLWMKLKGVDDSSDLVLKKAVEKKVLMVPGVSFIPGGGTSGFVRLSYSTASEEQMKEACRRLKMLLLEETGGVTE